MFLGITPVFSASNSPYFLTLPLVNVMHVIYTSKGMLKKFGGARYLSKNTVVCFNNEALEPKKKEKVS
jgi:hypothetical protein